MLLAAGIEARRERTELGTVIVLREISADDASNASEDESPVGKPDTAGIKEDPNASSNASGASNASSNARENSAYLSASGNTDNTGIRFGAKSEPLSADLKPGESARLQDLKALRGFLEDPPEWFRKQAAICMREGTPARLLNPLANAASTHLFGSPWRWQEVEPAVERWLSGEES